MGTGSGERLEGTGEREGEKGGGLEEVGDRAVMALGFGEKAVAEGR
jgi:hypothetical protein